MADTSDVPEEVGSVFSKRLPKAFKYIATIVLMNTGTIARLTDRGYGFIKPDGGEKDLFFHAKDLQELRYDDLREGDKVTFELAESPKGPNAVNVRRA